MSLNVKKLLSVNGIASVAMFVLSFIAFIIYLVNGPAGGGINDWTTTSTAVVSSIFAIILSAGIVVAQMTEKSYKIVETVVGICKIVVVALLLVAVMDFLSTRMFGFGFIFGSDENLSAETAKALPAAQQAITGIVFYVLAWVAAVVAAFVSKKVD